MALIKCPECGREISSFATSCPHCGYPISSNDLSDKLVINEESPSISGSFDSDSPVELVSDANAYEVSPDEVTPDETQSTDFSVIDSAPNQHSVDSSKATSTTGKELAEKNNTRLITLGVIVLIVLIVIAVIAKNNSTSADSNTSSNSMSESNLSSSTNSDVTVIPNGDGTNYVSFNGLAITLPDDITFDCDVDHLTASFPNLGILNLGYSFSGLHSFSDFAEAIAYYNEETGWKMDLSSIKRLENSAEAEVYLINLHNISYGYVVAVASGDELLAARFLTSKDQFDSNSDSMLEILSTLCVVDPQKPSFTPSSQSDTNIDSPVTTPVEEPVQQEPVQQEPVQQEPVQQETSYTTYAPGVYMIGTDLPAGEYVLVAASAERSAYYAVYPDASKSDILGNNNFELMDYVTVYNGQILEVNRASLVPSEEFDIDMTDLMVGSGRFKVGRDIPAGTYRLEKNRSGRTFGYYAVYNSSLPDADIIQNNNFESNDYVTVYDGQYLEISGCSATLQ